jgi:hypothetical protein
VCAYAIYYTYVYMYITQKHKITNQNFLNI